MEDLNSFIRKKEREIISLYKKYSAPEHVTDVEAFKSELTKIMTSIKQKAKYNSVKTAREIALHQYFANIGEDVTAVEAWNILFDKDKDFHQLQLVQEYELFDRKTVQNEVESLVYNITNL